MMPYIPSPLIEAANGVFCILVFWMLLYGVIYLHSTLCEYRLKYMGRGGWFRAVNALYNGNKPEIALMTFVFGLWTRQSMFWYFRILQDHEWKADNVITRNGPMLTVFTTAIMIVGISCWIRVISPVKNPVLIWILMVGSALGVSIGIAMMP